MAHWPWLLWAIDLALAVPPADLPAGRSALERVPWAYSLVSLIFASEILLGYPQYVWLGLLVAAPYALLRVARGPRPYWRPLVGLLSARVNAWRLALVDAMSLAFCAFFAWKSWALLREAVHEGQTTSSSWAPPLWIPYGLMSLGMTLLCVQLALQLVERAWVPREESDNTEAAR